MWWIHALAGYIEHTLREGSEVCLVVRLSDD